jgi:hypothetical protein
MPEAGVPAHEHERRPREDVRSVVFHYHGQFLRAD